MVGNYDSDLNAFGELASHEMPYSQMGFRIYSEEFGRFLSPDPLFEQFDSWTPYHFAFNNPVMYSDPSGLAPKKEKREAKLLNSYTSLEIEMTRKRMQEDFVNEYISRLYAHWESQLLNFDELLTYNRWQGGGGGESTGNFAVNTGNSIISNSGLKTRVVNYERGNLDFGSVAEAQEFADENSVQMEGMINSDGTYSVTQLTTLIGSAFNDDVLWDAFHSTIINAISYGGLMITTQMDKYTGEPLGSVATTYSLFNKLTIFIDKSQINNSEHMYFAGTIIDGEYKADELYESYSQIFWHELGHSFHYTAYTNNSSWLSRLFNNVNSFDMAVSFENYYLYNYGNSRCRIGHDINAMRGLEYPTGKGFDFFHNGNEEFRQFIRRYR